MLGFLLSAGEAETREKSQPPQGQRQTAGGTTPSAIMFLLGVCLLLLLCMLGSTLSPTLHVPPSGLYATLPVMALSGMTK